MIIPNETNDTLKELANTHYGVALRDFLNQAIDEIGDIRKTESWEETQGRKFALQVIEDLFGFLQIKEQGNVKRTKYY